MTPAEHYVEAERLLVMADRFDDRGHDTASVLAMAQVHATLAAAPIERGPAGDYAVGDRVTVVISDVEVEGLGDFHLYLNVPGVEEGIAVLLAADEGGDLPQVRVYRTAKGGA